MAEPEVIERSREMLTQIRGMCDEAEYMLHVNELNYAEALAFGDQVVILGNALRESVARQMNDPDPEKLPEDLKRLPVAMVKDGLSKLAQPYRESVRPDARTVIHIDTTGLTSQQAESVIAKFQNKNDEEWRSLSVYEKQKRINQLIVDIREGK